MNVRRAMSFLSAAVALAVPLIAVAQGYPSKPIRLIVPAAAGGGPDITARLIAGELGRQLGQQVVVDNRGGASGIIGYEIVAKAAADGYTLGTAAFPFITNPGMFARLPYDPVKDFAPVAQLPTGANLLTVTSAIPVKSVKELIDHARAQPGKLSYGSAAAGGSQYLAMELFKIMSKTQFVQVGYKGMQQAVTDAIAGQVQIICENIGPMLPHVRSGRMRALGVTTLKRQTILPDVPTVAEAGLSGYEVAPSSGYLLPAGTPRDIVLRLNAEINKAIRMPAMTEKLLENGGEFAGGTPEQYADHLRRETAKWTGVIRAAGIKPQ